MNCFGHTGYVRMLPTYTPMPMNQSCGHSKMLIHPFWQSFSRSQNIQSSRASEPTSVEVRNAYCSYGTYGAYSSSRRIVHTKCRCHPFCFKFGTVIAQGTTNRRVNFRGGPICLSKVIRDPRLTKAKPPSGTATGTYCAYALICAYWPNKGQ